MSKSVTLGGLTIESDGHSARFDHDAVPLRVTLGCAVDATVIEHGQGGSKLTLYFDDNVKLSVNYAQGDGIYDRYDVKWTSTNAYHYMKDVVSTDSGGYWYGGPQIAQQDWPLARDSNRMCPYVTEDVLKEDAQSQSGMERYWLCSNKFAVYVPDEVPLWTEHWGGGLSLQSQIRDSLYESFFVFNLEPETGAPVLKYSIFALKSGRHDSLKDFHMAVHNSLYEKPNGYPDERIIRDPIWSTWVRYKKDITQAKVLEFADEIKAHNAPISQLEIDDNWATCYGDFQFDTSKFPDVKGMCSTLAARGITVSLWVHPFVNRDSVNGRDVFTRGFIVKASEASGLPVDVKWWNGDGYIVDFTDSEAVTWYREQLNNLRQVKEDSNIVDVRYEHWEGIQLTFPCAWSISKMTPGVHYTIFGIDTFKFDAGEVTYLTKHFHLAGGKTPKDFVTAYVWTASAFGRAIEVRTFGRTQAIPVFVRTQDRLSTWNRYGLTTVLPVTLNFSIHGYAFNLPDMVAGNCYNESCDKELYIRWMQLNQLLLAIQFSRAPWQYDEETSDLFAALMKVRRGLVHHLIEACKRVPTTGEPVICPMWWVSESHEALSCSDQFVVNGTLIVAPVVNKGVTSRSVFLPEGTWRYALNQQEFTGPLSVVVDAPLIASVPYFLRVEH